MSIILKALLSAAWVSSVGAGLGYAWRYESTPGKLATASDWPVASSLRLDASRPTIVMFAHPSCPCTKVGVEQLADIVRRNPRAARLYFVMVQASGLSKDLSASESAVAARKIEGAVVLSDAGGREAKRFGATTSGQVLAFDASGKQLFRGGVTAARGHYGPNGGIDALASVLQSKYLAVTSTPVYGCSLLGDVK